MHQALRPAQLGCGRRLLYGLEAHDFRLEGGLGRGGRASGGGWGTVGRVMRPWRGFELACGGALRGGLDGLIAWRGPRATPGGA